MGVVMSVLATLAHIWLVLLFIAGIVTILWAACSEFSVNGAVLDRARKRGPAEFSSIKFSGRSQGNR